MISKKMIREVLPLVTCTDSTEINMLTDDRTVVIINEKLNDTINIYELAYKCKEWSKTKGYHVFSTLVVNSDEGISIINFGSDNEREFLAISESESIFKACEWILQEIERCN